MMTNEYPEVKLTDLSAISHSYHPIASEGQRRADILIVRFYGTYGHGSGGNTDATVMRAVVHAGLEIWVPRRLVLDFRALSYEWGDMMTSVLCVGNRLVSNIQSSPAGSVEVCRSNLPTAVVVSDRCREAITSLVVDEMDQDPSSWLFESLEAALAASRK